MFLSLIKDPVVVTLTIGFLLAALFVGRPRVFLFPVVGWPLLLLMVEIGGSLGDEWQYALLVEILFGVPAVAVGLLLRRLVVR